LKVRSAVTVSPGWTSGVFPTPSIVKLCGRVPSFRTEIEYVPAFSKTRNGGAKENSLANSS
jgi:hypothetical protein